MVSMWDTMLISLTRIILSNCVDVSNIMYIYTVDYTSVKLGRKWKSAERKIESLKNYLNGYLTACYPNEDDKAKWRFKSPKVILGFRKSTTVEVPDLDKLDKTFIKIKTETSADKKAIKEAITNGQKVQGAFLKQNVNLSVKWYGVD